MVFAGNCRAGAFRCRNPRRVADTPESLLQFHQKVYADRADIPYDLDGVVYKVNDLEYQRRLGFISRSPRWATAHKFPAQQAETVIRAITIQVGRTGVLTPVAELGTRQCRRRDGCPRGPCTTKMKSCARMCARATTSSFKGRATSSRRSCAAFPSAAPKTRPPLSSDCLPRMRQHRRARGGRGEDALHGRPHLPRAGRSSA